MSGGQPAGGQTAAGQARDSQQRYIPPHLRGQANPVLPPNLNQPPPARPPPHQQASWGSQQLAQTARHPGTLFTIYRYADDFSIPSHIQYICWQNLTSFLHRHSCMCVYI